MKEYQDHNFDNTIENDVKSMKEENDSNDYTNDQNIQEGVSENAEGVDELREGNEEKKGDSCQKAEADPSEDQGGEEEIPPVGEGCSRDRKDAVTEQDTFENYSCSYKPPYYVPDFTVVDDMRADPNKKKGGGRARGWMIGLSALIVALAMLGGVFVGLRLGMNEARFKENGTAPNGDGNSVTASKNNSPIRVSVDIDDSEANALSIEQVVERVSDSVVEIVTTQVQTGMFGYGQYVTGGAGSGVLIDTEGRGYIITNQHVIGDNPNQTTITVRLSNGTEYVATYLAGDVRHDIAVLKIDGTDLPHAVMGSSESLKVGQGVVAIGNPLGELGGTVTNGIISAKDRQVIIDGNRMTLLQTNAQINPGNSGGGLFDMAGRLIGIVNAKQAATGIEGLGFAIPIDVAWSVASDLIQYGYVTDQLVLPFAAEYRDDLTVSFPLGGNRSMPKGVYIFQSQRQDLKDYDRIVSVNGHEVDSISDYYQAMDQLKKGDTLTLVVSRLSRSQSSDFAEYTVSFVPQFTEAPNN